jgi:hypothetical protein
MVPLSTKASPLSSTSTGIRPTGFQPRTVARSPKPESARRWKGISYSLSVIATRIWRTIYTDQQHLIITRRYRDLGSHHQVRVARSERFELPTLGIEIRCSIQLSYERVAASDIRVRKSVLEHRPRNRDAAGHPARYRRPNPGSSGWMTGRHNRQRCPAPRQDRSCGGS